MVLGICFFVLATSCLRRGGLMIWEGMGGSYRVNLEGERDRFKQRIGILVWG